MKPQMHYIVPGRDKQPIELMRMGLTDAEFDGYCIGNIVKYILRFKHKGGINDLYKAREYIDFLTRAYNDEPILGDEDEDPKQADLTNGWLATDEEAIWRASYLKNE